MKCKYFRASKRTGESKDSSVINIEFLLVVMVNPPRFFLCIKLDILYFVFVVVVRE